MNAAEVMAKASCKRVKALQALFAWAMEADLVRYNPTLGVRKIKYPTVGHHRWTPDKIEQFKATPSRTSTTGRRSAPTIYSSGRPLLCGSRWRSRPPIFSGSVISCREPTRLGSKLCRPVAKSPEERRAVARNVLAAFRAPPLAE
jgi:hypothetical protein